MPSNAVPGAEHAVESLRSEDALADHLRDRCFTPSADAPVLGAVGLEAEAFVVQRADRRRSTLDELVTALDQATDCRRDDTSDRPVWHHPDGMLTEEPGGQIELITAPEASLAASLDKLDSLARVSSAALDLHGMAVSGTGLDAFHPPEDLDVQLDNARYEAMGAYFARRGTNGRALMCASASLQVNLDLGPPEVAARRWLLANLAAPSIISTFANSPSSEAVNGRSLAWMRLDPTRTGVPGLLAAGSDDPVAHLLWDVLRADVMLVSRDGTMHPGRPGWRFSDWLRGGHPVFGYPTSADADLHMSTLFPEVRLRGWIEVRGVDQQPRRWRPAAAVLLTGLLYDTQALEEALALLSPRRGALPKLQERAAHRGLLDAQVAALALPLWEIALEGAARLGEYVGDEWLGIADAFLSRFARRRRHPGDEQREVARRGAEALLEWSR